MAYRLHKLKQQRGFTLVELIVVIAIVGVLAAILVPTMIGYVTNAQVMSANSTASTLKRSVDAFLTNADNEGYGMLKSSSNICSINITIVNSNWTINRTGGSFSTGGNLYWEPTGVGNGYVGQSKNTATNYESLLAITLTDVFPEVDNGTFFVSVGGGKCLAVAFCRGRTADLVAGTDYPVLESDGSFPAVFSWNNTNPGVTDVGEVVGTAPMVPLG